ncbi:protein PTHB1 isoform X2 [Vespa velutina]|uniref:protein PTHB1 isoform X2 n=1 Tax=Vespa velutina TaxID=202808 RepID=UPI001FB3F6FF|nr:protein PTHB1 isoform X2 [Vespa velutina]
MSLFKTKEWWRTKCGSNETFDRSSLLVVSLFEDDKKDCVVIGSHQGYLRIYNLSSQWQDETKSSTGYKSIDLMIETKLGDCIVDIKAGKLVSGSQDTRLAVLTSSKLIVYTVTLTKGSIEHGDQCNLEIAYEHRLPRFPASLVVGPFGGVRGRDFLCVQCLDGTLFFYEQEAYAFSQLLRNRLLPEPIVYISRNDVFVTSNCSWILECYRYQNIAEFGRNQKDGETKNEATKSLEPEWSYNIGEAVVDIGAVTLSSFEIGIVVLGEKNLYCFKDTGASLKYTKRLDYKALCFHAYVIEPDGKLMVFVIADTSTLMIYEGTTLKWSAQLPFVPVAVTRAHFQYLDGLIVILSEEGQLEACYLGSEPSLFIAPAVHRRGFDYIAAEEELLELRRKLKEMKLSGDQLAVTPVTDMELLVNVNISPDLEPCPFVDKESKEDQEIRQLSMCRATIELSSYTTLYEFSVDHLRKQNWNMLGLQHIQTGHVVTIVSGSTSNRYRVQSNDGLSMSLVVQQLVNRLKDKSTGRLAASISQHHVQLVHVQMELHFLCRQEVDRINTELALLMTQLRNIEKRMLRAARERNSRSLNATGLSFLLSSTYNAISGLLDDLAAAQMKREHARHGLHCALRLLLLLLRLNVNNDKYTILESAIGFEAQLRDEVNWEEVADAGLAVFLRSVSKKQTNNTENKSFSWNKFTSMKDIAKLKKRLTHAVERLDDCKESGIDENETESGNFNFL